VDVVSFTGGTTVGTEIVRTAAGRLAKVVLELGGKSAGIVADDQPIEELLPLVLPGLLPFQGQVCVALSRLLVSRARHDEVVGALAAAFGAVTIGDVADPRSTSDPWPRHEPEIVVRRSSLKRWLRGRRSPLAAADPLTKAGFTSRPS
jgi:betaine-aldehyde dehydrogenase